ncbi:MAG: hypothetical protein V3S27_05740 [Kiloniellales bacterium]
MTTRALWPAATVLVLVACAAGPVAAAESVEACLANKFPTNQLNCLSRLAEERGDVEVCLRAEQPGVRFQCVSLYAERARDPTLCRKIPAEDSVPEGVFQETCRAGLAVTLNQPELCAGLATPNLGDACYLQMVEAGADAALCARIENAIIKSACGGE